MRRLLKYTISGADRQITKIVSAPGLRPLAVGWQDTKLVVWAEGNTPKDSGGPFTEVEYQFMAVWTGQYVPDGAWNYVGSAQMRHQELGFLVVHLYFGGML